MCVNVDMIETTTLFRFLGQVLTPIILVITGVSCVSLFGESNLVVQTSRINQEIITATVKINAERTHNQLKIPPELLFGLFWQESNYNPNADNIHTSACGLGQILKATARKVGLDDCHDEVTSIEAAIRLLSENLDHFSRPRFGTANPYWLAIAAYHAGPNCVEIAFAGKKCEIKHEDTDECRARRNCDTLIVTKCDSSQFRKCLPPETTSYVHFVYDLYAPLGRAFIDWRTKEERATREGTKESQTVASDAKVKFEKDYITLQKAVGDLQFDILPKLYSQAFSDPGTYLFERNAAYPLDTNGNLIESRDVPCAAWEVFVNDDYEFQLRYNGSTQEDLPYPLRNLAKRVGHGGIVKLGFTIDGDLEPENITVLDGEFGQDYKEAARTLLLRHRFALFTPFEVYLPDQFRFSPCRLRKSLRAVTFVFGQDLDFPHYQTTDGHSKALLHDLGDARELGSMSVAFTRVDSKGSATTIKRYFMNPVDQGRLCREETLETGVYWIINGHSTFTGKGKEFERSYNDPSIQEYCDNRWIPNLIDLGSAPAVYLGHCKAADLQVGTFDCFLLDAFASRYPPRIYVVDSARHLPTESIPFHFEPYNFKSTKTVFDDYRTIGALTIPFSAAEVAVDAGNSVQVGLTRITDLSIDQHLPPDYFDPAKVP